MTDRQLFVAAGAYEGIILGFRVNLGQGAANPTITLTFTERTHTASVKAVKFSGNILLSGSSDENVHVFDVGRRRFLGALHFPEGEIGAIETVECDETSPAAAGEGGAEVRRTQYALIADGDLRVTVLRVNARRLAIGAIQTYKRALKMHDARKLVRAAPFGAMATHPSGKLILAVSSCRKRLFTFSFDADATRANANRKPLKLEHTLPLHREPISVRWNESGTRYALALRAARTETAQGDELRVFSVPDGRECARLRVAPKLTAFEWLAGDRLVAACADGMLRVYRLLEAADAAGGGETESAGERTHTAVSECEFRVGASRVKALSVLQVDGETPPHCLIACVSSDGLVSVLAACTPDESESASSMQLRPLCSFKSVFRFTCVTAGVIQPKCAPSSAAIDAETEQQRISACDYDDSPIDVQADTDTDRRSIVELATRSKQRETAGLRRRSDRTPPAGAQGIRNAAGGKRKRPTASRSRDGNEASAKVKAPRRAEMSKLEKKVRRWTAADGRDAAKGKMATPAGCRSELKEKAAKEKRVQTADG